MALQICLYIPFDRKIQIERWVVLNGLKLLLVLVSAVGLAAGFLAPYFGLNCLQHTLWGLTAAIILLFLVGRFSLR